MMNSLSLPPPPLDKISLIFKSIIKKKIKIDFNFGCNILLGNLKGVSALLNNSFILDYAPITFGNNVSLTMDITVL